MTGLTPDRLRLSLWEESLALAKVAVAAQQPCPNEVHHHDMTTPECRCAAHFRMPHRGPPLTHLL